MFKYTLITLVSAAILNLTGCGNSIPQLSGDIPVSSADFVYNGHNFGPNRTETYRSGVIDGCKTSNGDYTKDHTRFKSDIHYHDGWEHGRLHCKGEPDTQ